MKILNPMLLQKNYRQLGLEHERESWKSVQIILLTLETLPAEKTKNEHYTVAETTVTSTMPARVAAKDKNC
jgi:hypothetical protein